MSLGNFNRAASSDKVTTWAAGPGSICQCSGTREAMATQQLPGPADHADLRAALEFAVGIAEAGQRLRPPLGYPPELKQFFRLDRLPAGALGRVRRIVEAGGCTRA